MPIRDEQGLQRHEFTYDIIAVPVTLNTPHNLDTSKVVRMEAFVNANINGHIIPNGNVNEGVTGAVSNTSGWGMSLDSTNYVVNVGASSTALVGGQIVCVVYTKP